MDLPNSMDESTPQSSWIFLDETQFNNNVFRTVAFPGSLDAVEVENVKNGECFC